MPPISALVAKLKAAGVALPAGPLRADGYGDSPVLSRALIDLIRSGTKRAGTGLLWAMQFDGEALPRSGDIEIVVDHEFEPVLVTHHVRGGEAL